MFTLFAITISVLCAGVIAAMMLIVMLVNNRLQKENDALRLQVTSLMRENRQLRTDAKRKSNRIRGLLHGQVGGW